MSFTNSIKLRKITVSVLLNFTLFSLAAFSSAQEFEPDLPSLKEKAKKPSLGIDIKPKDPYDKTNTNKKYWPTIKVAPHYPRMALYNHIEGFVIVIFDIARNGHPTNIRVEESSNPIFNEPSIISVRKYVYKFSTEPDKEIMVKNVKSKISFELEPLNQ